MSAALDRVQRYLEGADDPIVDVHWAEGEQTTLRLDDLHEIVRLASEGIR